MKMKKEMIVSKVIKNISYINIILLLIVLTQDHLDEMIIHLFTLTRGYEFKFGRESGSMLNLVRKNFVIHCGPT